MRSCRTWTPSAVLLVVSAMLGACSRSPASPTPPESEPSGRTVTRADLDFCVSETNRLRASVGMPAMGTSAAVEQFAATAAQVDHIANVPHSYFASQGPNGAENEALRWGAVFAGTTTHSAIASAIAGFWSEGPGGPHWQNIAGPRTQVACGVYHDGTLTTVVQEFR